jgi:hypothetical protein
LQKTIRVKQQLFLKDLMALDAFSLKCVDKVQLYEVYNHYLHYSVFVSSTGQEKQLCLQRCSFIVGMDLKLTLHRTQAKDHWWLIKASNDSILMCWQFTTSLSHLYIKQWRLRELWETQQQFTSAKTLSKLFCIKVHFRIS